ncbi:head GIN domain-containing protein [Olivibacter ginsenosidimutans]
MKQKISSIGWLMLLLPFLCIGISQATVLHGKSYDETRQVSGFHAIENVGSIDVEITIGNQESLKIIGNKEAIDLVETQVKNGILVIRIKNNHEKLFNNWKVQKNLRIQLTAKSLDGIKQSGSGNIKVNNTVKGDQLRVAVSGSGDMVVPVAVTHLSAAITGSGDMDIQGSAQTADIRVTGSGDFEGNALKTKEANVTVTGSGDLDIFVSDTLNAQLSGSGDITYDGNPKQVNKHKSGSGDISAK